MKAWWMYAWSAIKGSMRVIPTMTFVETPYAKSAEMSLQKRLIRREQKEGYKNLTNKAILDSGERRSFGTGAVRDAAKGKGRMDLIPLNLVAEMVAPETDQLLASLEYYQRSGDLDYLKDALAYAFDTLFPSCFDAILEYSKHMEAGCLKYAERNWEKGIFSHVYLDCAARHYIKCLRGDVDENHDRAVVWNLFGAWWTHVNCPQLNDLPFTQEVQEVQEVQEEEEGIIRELVTYVDEKYLL